MTWMCVKELYQYLWNAEMLQLKFPYLELRVSLVLPMDYAVKDLMPVMIMKFDTSVQYIEVKRNVLCKLFTLSLYPT